MAAFKWWHPLNKGEKQVLLLLAMVPYPLSLDALIAVSGLKAVKLLQFLDDMTKEGTLSNDDSFKKGFYTLASGTYRAFILENTDNEDLKKTATELIAYLEETSEEEPERILTLAHLHKSTDITPQRMDYVMAAAEFCEKKERHEEAIVYFQFILDKPASQIKSFEEKEVYVNAAISLSAAYGHMLFLPDQTAYLEKAQAFAEEINKNEKLLNIQLALGKTLEVGGFYTRAASHLEQAWGLAQKLENEHLLKKAALMTSDFLFRQGRVAEAVARYEDTIGDLEAFSSDASTLRACATLGWCYGVCGQTSRGNGLIEAVRIKAKEYGMKDIEIFADLMIVNTLLEARRISEAEIYLKKLLDLPEDVAGHAIHWATHWCLAFLAFCGGDLDKCLEEHILGCELLKKYGRPHHRGGWVMEYLEGLEMVGSIPPEMTLTSELNRLMDWPDIFMKGVAHRFSGQKALRASRSAASAKADFQKSLEMLTQSGARLELARTQIVLARTLLGEGNSEEAKKLLEDAWDAMSRSNAKLFPEDLKPYLTEKTHEDLLIDTIVEITNVLGTVREKKKLLELVIHLTMRFTFAERGGFFLFGENRELEMVASRNMDLEMVQSDRFQPYFAEIENVARSGRECIRETTGSETFGHSANPINSWMICSPVTLQDRVLGVLYLASKVTPDYLKNDMPLLRAISTQVAVALDNVTAYERIAALKDRLEEETRYYRMDRQVSPQLKHMVGDSNEIRLVQRQIQKVAPMDSTVLINGETGVGKELVARGIHQLSKRFNGPFIAVNVASLSEGVIESELFGHEKGAFSGAVSSRLGRFELAQGGTLFLDDIQNLSLDIQAKLLRILEEKEFERVGGIKLKKADFRLIAATNRSLKELVAEKQFRSDLYYRLNVFPIHVPPLRERKADIPLLAIHFLEMYNNNLGKKIEGISNQKMKQLLVYAWPGNVRELRHVIERAVILSEGSSLVIPSLPPPAKNEDDPQRIVTLEEMERTYIIRALKKSGFKVGGPDGAALALGLKPTTLHSKIKKLGIRKKITPA